MSGERTIKNSSIPTKSRMPPPLPFAVGILVGLGCHLIWPWYIGRYYVVLAVALGLLGVVLALSISLNKAFKQHATPPDPKKATTALIVTGPFKRSRNPAYIAVVILHAAIGCLFNSVWVLLMIIPALFVVHFVVVLREEVYLEHKFGEKYRNYKARVRRWI